MRCKYDCIGALIKAFKHFCFSKFGSELTSRCLVQGYSYVVVLFPISVNVLLLEEVHLAVLEC